MHYLALGFKRIYEFLILFPRWVLMIASGAVANIVMKAMHSNAGTDQPQPKPVAKETTPESAPAPAAKEKTTDAKASPAKSKGKRKNAKK